MDFDDEQNGDHDEAGDAETGKVAGLPSAFAHNQESLDNDAANQRPEEEYRHAGGEFHKGAHPEAGLALAQLGFDWREAGIISPSAEFDSFGLHGATI
ncbi:MAG TPA: hypothetical protein VGP94_09400 [Tepidisphaeraceae bacterium]|nr:hypothetical protein [Tepidisphaeraceae bacterium]